MSLTRNIALKFSVAGLCFAMLAMIVAGSASADPGSMAEAEAAGDPAASAPVTVTPSVWMYQGEEISEAQAMQLELACIQSATEFSCKDSASEVENIGSDDAEEGQASRRACGVFNLMLYRDKQYEGTAIALATFNTWVDVPAEMNNATSSYRTGEASAHLSDFGGGGGFWYPGATGVCDFHSNISQVYPEWNDRISSRYRF